MSMEPSGGGVQRLPVGVLNCWQDFVLFVNSMVIQHLRAAWEVMLTSVVSLTIPDLVGVTFLGLDSLRGVGISLCGTWLFCLVLCGLGIPISCSARWGGVINRDTGGVCWCTRVCTWWW